MRPRRVRQYSSSYILIDSNIICETVVANQDFLRTAGIEPTPALLQSVATYIELLLRWNRKLNLTAITDPREIVTRNFVESFLATRWLQQSEGRLCDVGSGAGFPGLALKLVLPKWHVNLVEPTTKKAVFLTEAARTLGLRNVQVDSCRWQESKLPPSSADAITSRALGGHRELAEWAKERLKPGGKLILWLGVSDAQVVTRFGNWHWELEAVAGSRERVILVGTHL